MPTLNLTDGQATMVVDALKRQRWHLMSEWSKTRADEDMAPFVRDSECERVDAEIVTVGLLRQHVEAMIEVQRGFRSRSEVQADFGQNASTIEEVRAFADEVMNCFGHPCQEADEASKQDVEEINSEVLIWKETPLGEWIALDPAREEAHVFFIRRLVGGPFAGAFVVYPGADIDKRLGNQVTFLRSPGQGGGPRFSDADELKHLCETAASEFLSRGAKSLTRPKAVIELMINGVSHKGSIRDGRDFERALRDFARRH